MPSDKHLVVETSVNAGGEHLYILHATFGAWVNGVWAIAGRRNQQIRRSAFENGL